MISLILTVRTETWAAWFVLLIGLVIWYKPYLWEGVFVVTANLVTGIGAPMLWDSLKPYQQDRLRVFLDPSVDPRRSGYHVIQSQTAIGSGGWFGQGYTEGSQKRLAFLPEQHTDFIFAVLGEELGFMGVTLALALFLTLFLRIIKIGERANDSFSSLVAMGLLASWFVHVLINVGMTVKLMPITGIPLPFFSYGGTFMLASWLATGVLCASRMKGEAASTGRLRFRAAHIARGWLQPQRRRTVLRRWRQFSTAGGSSPPLAAVLRPKAGSCLMPLASAVFSNGLVQEGEEAPPAAA
jgi:rod shape determining protein RodA